MLASKIIARYEAYCPQELSMEGDVSGPQIGTLDKEVDKVRWIFVSKRWRRPLRLVLD